jgi:hypothetical protein
MWSSLPDPIVRRGLPPNNGDRVAVRPTANDLLESSIMEGA